jgi:hypothetical protein
MSADGATANSLRVVLSDWPVYTRHVQRILDLRSRLQECLTHPLGHRTA